MTQFERETRQLTEAVQRLERDRAALVRPDGQPKFSPEEHREREQALLATFGETADRVFASVDQATREAELTLDALENADPLAGLDAAALPRVRCWRR